MTVTHRVGKRQHEEEPAINEPGFCISCDGCGANLTHSIRLKCADPVCLPGDGIDLCPRCFCEGKEFNQHKRHHPYRVVELHAYPIFSEDWGADEELLLVDGIAQNGIGNWEAIAEHIGTRTKEEVEEHYKTVYLNSPNWPLPDTSRHFDIDPSDFQERKRRRISSMPTAPPAPKVAPTSAPGIHEIATYLPGRLEFEIEPDNEAEELIKDLMFGLVMQWGGDGLKEDEKDRDVIKRVKWIEERKAALERMQSQQPPQPPALFGFEANANGGMVNGFHLSNGGSADRKNGFDKRGNDRKEKREKKKEDEDEGEEDEEDNEDNLPPIPHETEESIRFKLTIIDMYLQRVERREQGKALMFQRGLLEYKKMQQAEKKRPKEEKEILHRLRPFAKLQTAEDYEQFCADTLYESLLRKRIAELQAYRRNGLTTPADIHTYELDAYKRSQAKSNMARELHVRQPSGRSSLQPEARRAGHDDAADRDGTPGGKGAGAALRKPPAPLNLANSPLLHLLTPAEQTLCSTLRILPKPYLVIKETLVREYARRGGKLRRREARDLVKIDVNKTSRVWDFLMQAGFLRIGDSSTNNNAGNANAQVNGNVLTTPAATPAPSTQAATPSPSKPPLPGSAVGPSQHTLPPPPAPPQLASVHSSSSTSSQQFSNGPRMFPPGAGGPGWVPLPQ
ncbi:SWIRM-domain-containing protein [Peniophora sp. CONT]|nr:SWIRM-domain-containing protein [Peniophora sp. CONT]